MTSSFRLRRRRQIRARADGDAEAAELFGHPEQRGRHPEQRGRHPEQSEGSAAAVLDSERPIDQRAIHPNPSASMRVRISALAIAVMFLPRLVAAQAAPVAAAFRDNGKEQAKNLVAAAELMPADKFSYKPTPAQMSFGDIVNHLSGGNDYFCGLLGGVKPPTRTKVDATAPKE